MGCTLIETGLVAFTTPVAGLTVNQFFPWLKKVTALNVSVDWDGFVSEMVCAAAR